MSDDHWRPLTPEEIRTYYEETFPTQIGNLPDWIGPNTPKQYGFALNERYGRENNLPPTDFIRRDTRKGNRMVIEDWQTFFDWIQDPVENEILHEDASGGGLSREATEKNENLSTEPLVTEAAYYALDNHETFWMLAFDIDAKDIAKERVQAEEQARNENTPFETEKEVVRANGVYEQPPRPVTVKTANGERKHEYAYSFNDLREALNQGFELKTWLADTVGFDETYVFYSGQGCHIYARDNDPYYKWTQQSRAFLSEYIEKKLEIPIDTPVTIEDNRLLRLPYSIHSEVNRVVTEIDDPDYDFRSNAFFTN